MKWFRKKKAFEPADLEESTEYPANPDCGWYEIYTFQIENSIDPEELKWSLHEEGWHWSFWISGHTVIPHWEKPNWNI